MERMPANSHGKIKSSPVIKTVGFQINFCAQLNICVSQPATTPS
jgi:hypothetical protein